MELSDGERTLIEVLRTAQDDKTNNFAVVIRRQDGAWETSWSEPLRMSDGTVGQRSVSGTGSTFDAAWGNPGPTWSNVV